jgi:hypothetical protein
MSSLVSIALASSPVLAWAITGIGALGDDANRPLHTATTQAPVCEPEFALVVQESNPLNISSQLIPLF